MTSARRSQRSPVNGNTQVGRRPEQIRTLITPGAGFTILSRLPINYGPTPQRGI